MLFLIGEILFEFLKLRLSEYGILFEHYERLNYNDFHLKIQYDCFGDYMNLMKIIMQFFPCPDASKNHPNIQHFLKFRETILETDLFRDNPYEQTHIHKAPIKILLVSYNLSGIDPYMNSLSLESFFNKVNSYDADIIILGFQELMELKMKIKNIKSMMNTGPLIEKWYLLLQKYVKDFVPIT